MKGIIVLLLFGAMFTLGQSACECANLKGITDRRYGTEWTVPSTFKWRKSQSSAASLGQSNYSCNSNCMQV